MQGAVGIDYTAALTQGGGIGRYTRDLVAAVAEQDSKTRYRLFAAGMRRGNLPPCPGENFQWRSTRVDPVWFARLWHRLRLPVPIERWLGDIVVLHAPDFALPPTHRKTRTLLTVHDLSFIREPWTAAPGLRAYLNHVVPRSVARADRVLADSEATRNDLIEIYGTSESKIHVLYSGVHDAFYPVEDKDRLKEIRARYEIGSHPYIFSVGTVQPRKNYDRLVEALHQLNEPDVKLVIAGGKGWLDDSLYRRIADLGLQKRVIFLGFTADEDLPALYSAARLFAFPSLYEGFGLPPLEAMACGVPVVASDRSSLPEVIGNAGLLVNPYDVDALAHALSRGLHDETLRNSLINRGQLRVQSFTWSLAARKLLTHYSELAS